MNLWINEIEKIIRNLYDKEIGNSDDLVIFKMTENMECEIQKDDGSRTRIPRRIIDTYETDQNARQVLLSKLRDFKVPKAKGS